MGRAGAVLFKITNHKNHKQLKTCNIMTQEQTIWAIGMLISLAVVVYRMRRAGVFTGFKNDWK